MILKHSQMNILVGRFARIDSPLTTGYAVLEWFISLSLLTSANTTWTEQRTQTKLHCNVLYVIHVYHFYVSFVSLSVVHWAIFVPDLQLKCP